MGKLVLSLVAGAAMATASAASATAFIGTTGGCFGTGCTPTPMATLVNGGSTLVFNAGSFNQLDSNGFVAIGSAGNPNTLGTFTLTGTLRTSSTYNSPFTLLVSFTSPTGVTGVPSTAATFFSTITGSVTNTNAGGIFVDFDNTAHQFTWNSGTFTLRVNDLNVSNGGVNAPISGQINAVANIPEAKTWAMMLFGFAGIGFAMRRRKQTLLQIA